MGIFKKNKMKVIREDFKLINGYNPVFTSYDGGLYEMELTRAAISSIAQQASKLNPIINSKSSKFLKFNIMLGNTPNKKTTTQQFLNRLVTILLCENNAFIIPIYSDDTAQEIIGLYPARSLGARIVEVDGVEYLIYKIGNEEYAEEYEKIGHLKLHQYKSEFLGESNLALKDTLDLIFTQSQGIKEGIKNSANIRFLGRLANVFLPEKLKAERKRVREDNLSVENNGGIMLFDSKYAEIKQIDSKPFIVDDRQLELIKKNVYDYFHVSENIIQCKASEDEWNAFYEGNIEVIALQIGQVLTKMLLTEKEINKGIKVILESSRLQFASNNTKLIVSQTLFDRGVLTQNQVNDIFNLPHVENGDKRYIRKEYAEINQLGVKELEEEKQKILDEVKLEEQVKEEEKSKEENQNKNLKEGEKDE